MSRIFISHSSWNNAEALAMREWLNANGWPQEETFLDIDPERGLVAGFKWQEALQKAAGRCEAVVFLVSRAWLDSHWCRAEFLLAKNLGKKIFSAILDETTIADLSREFPELTHEQAVSLSAPGETQSFIVAPPPVHEPVTVVFSARALLSLKSGLEKAGLDARSFAFDPSREIFRGLRALEEEDAAIFFGRDGKIAEALDSLRAVTAKGDARLFVILGASGAGKSSFLRAGLLPRIARDDRRWLRLPPLRPERAALTGDSGLYAVLERAFARLETPRARGTLAEQVGEGGLLPVIDTLRCLAAQRLLDPDAVAPIAILPIDQGEELFQPDESGEAAKLIAAVTPALEAGALMLFLAMRSDGFARLQSDPVLGAMKAEIFSLPPLPKGAFQQVIEGPVKRLQAASGEAALRLDPQLTEALLEDVGGEAADALPLLAFVMERLNRAHGAEGALTREHYAKAGGLQGAIEAAAAQALTDPTAGPFPIPMAPAERDALLRRVFIPHLAQIDGETRSARRRVADWDTLSADERNMAERLVAVRLLVKRQDDATAGVKVEPAHEALLRRWPRLSGWLKDEEEALIQFDGVLRAAEEWNANGLKPDFLTHLGARLSTAVKLNERPDFARLMSGLPAAYLRACKELERNIHKKSRRSQAMAVTLSIATPFMIGSLASQQISLFFTTLVLSPLAGFIYLFAASFLDRIRGISDRFVPGRQHRGVYVGFTSILFTVFVFSIYVYIMQKFDYLEEKEQIQIIFMFFIVLFNFFTLRYLIKNRYLIGIIFVSLLWVFFVVLFGLSVADAIGLDIPWNGLFALGLGLAALLYIWWKMTFALRN